MPKLNDCPKCERAECACCAGGYCVVLTNNDFNKDCPFFKTKEQVAKEQEYCQQRLAEIMKEENNNA